MDFLVNRETGQTYPSWTDNRAVGFLITYLDLDSDRSTEEQLVDGYRASAGATPILSDLSRWTLDEQGDLLSTKFNETLPKVSECTYKGDRVVVFDCAMTAIIRDGKIVWLARLD